MTKSSMPKSPRTAEQLRADDLRGWSNVLSLWRLCGNAACRRARCCRRNGTACFRQNYPLLPEGVRAWFEGLGEARKENYSFDEATEWLEGLGLMDEFRKWCEAVAGTVSLSQTESHRRIARQDPQAQ